MNPRLAELLLKREALVAKAAAQRTEIARAYLKWEWPVGVAAWGWKIFHFVKSHPLLVVGAVAALAASRRAGIGKLAKWARRAWFVWRVYRSVGLPGKITR